LARVAFYKETGVDAIRPPPPCSCVSISDRSCCSDPRSRNEVGSFPNKKDHPKKTQDPSSFAQASPMRKHRVGYLGPSHVTKGSCARGGEVRHSLPTPSPSVHPWGRAPATPLGALLVRFPRAQREALEALTDRAAAGGTVAAGAPGGEEGSQDPRTLILTKHFVGRGIPMPPHCAKPKAPRTDALSNLTPRTLGLVEYGPE